MNVVLHASEADRLEALDSYGVLSLGPTDPSVELYESVVRSAIEACGTAMGAINLVAANEQWRLAGPGTDDPFVERRYSICSDVVATEDSVVVEDFGSHPRYAELCDA